MLKNLKIHHIGIVVKKINEVSDVLETNLGFNEKSIPFEDIFQKVKVLFLSMGSIKIELIQPLTSDSPIQQFLEKGGGIHHIAFESEDFDIDLKKLLDVGAKPLQKEPTEGFEKRRIFFFYMPKSGIKVIELIETKLK